MFQHRLILNLDQCSRFWFCKLSIHISKQLLELKLFIQLYFKYTWIQDCSKIPTNLQCNLPRSIECSVCRALDWFLLTRAGKNKDRFQQEDSIQDFQMRWTHFSWHTMFLLCIWFQSNELKWAQVNWSLHLNWNSWCRYLSLNWV